MLDFIVKVAAGAAILIWVLVAFGLGIREAVIELRAVRQSVHEIEKPPDENGDNSKVT